MTTQAGPQSPIPSSCTRNHYILKKRGSGVFGDIYTSIPKATADSILADYDHTPASKAQTLINLRASLQATKVSSNPCEGHVRKHNGDDLDLEVAVLQKFRAATSSPHIVSLLDADPLPNCKMWCCLELLTAGSLDDLLEQYTAPHSTMPHVPESFIWHILHQLCCAFLLLHFGITGKDDRCDESLPQFYHHDIHLGNILLRRSEAGKATSASFGDYPDIVLCDFGQAKEVPSSTSAPPNERARGFRQQVRDVENGLVSIERIARVSTDTSTKTSLESVWEGFMADLMAGKDESGRNDLLLEKLRKLRDVAEQKRGKLYEPLPEGVREWLAREAVSDEEFEAAFAELRVV
jgi:serine/threonine protein kinase